MNNPVIGRSKLENILGTVFVNNPMVSHLWLIGLFLITLVSLVGFNVPSWLLIILVITFLLIVLLYIGTYLYFMFENPNMLLSEKTYLSFYKMEMLGKKDKESPYEAIQKEESIEGQVVPENKLKKQDE